MDEGPSLALASLESDLRRRSDQRIKLALQVATLRISDATDAEIREQLAITQAELVAAIADLRESLRPAGA